MKIQEFLIFFIVIISFPVFLASECQRNNEYPLIQLIEPKTQSPLFYNGDTMHIRYKVSDVKIVSYSSIEIKNSKDSTIYLNSFNGASNEITFADKFVFIVNDHSNFIMTIKAKNIKGTEHSLPVFIHVMP